MDRISKYVSYREGTFSQTAKRYRIDNTPNANELERMKYVATEIFDKVREHFNKPLTVSSFFRCKALNSKIGGSATSQHMTGEAIDIDADFTPGVTNKQIFEWIRDNCEFDQLIEEFPDKTGNPSWVHVSLKKNGKNRKQVLKIG